MCKRQTGGNRGAAIARLKAQLVGALKQHLAGVAPAPPVAGVILWQVFCALSDVRAWGEVGPDPIAPVQVEAYCKLMCLALLPHHVSILLAMDRAWLEWARIPAADRVAGELTPERFDLMFG